MSVQPDPSVTRTQRWIVVAECPFLPATGGAELEHRGFLAAALRRGLVAAVVMPVKADAADRAEAVRSFLGDVPLITVPRAAIATTLRKPSSPFMVSSREGDAGLTAQVRAAAPGATGVIVFAYKSHRLGRTLARELGLPVIVRMHNHEGRYYRSIARPGNHRAWPLVFAEAMRVEADERRLERAGDVAGLADISPLDAKIRGARASIPVRFVPSFAFAGDGSSATARTPEPAATAPTALFLGALDIQTNIDAVTWLVEKVWPVVHAALPDARLDIVGRAPLPVVRDLVDAAAGVTLHPDVPSTEPYLDRAHLAVNPAISGAGVNIKLIEYLLAGLPVVSTTRGSAGLGLGADDGLALADDEVTFADAMIELLGHPEHAQEMAERGRRAAQALRDPEPGLLALTQLLGGDAGEQPVGAAAAVAGAAVAGSAGSIDRTHQDGGPAMASPLDLLKADLQTGYGPAGGGWARLLPAFLHPRFRAIAWWRLAQPLFHRSALTRYLAMGISGHVVSLAGADLHPRAQVGPGLTIQHCPGIVLGQYVVAGERLTLHQNVTLGDRHPGGGQPTLGNDVVLGAGACVLGPVTVGDGAVIAANAVVLDDVPAGCVVAGAPAKVVRRPATD